MMGLARYALGDGLSYLACCARHALASSGPHMTRTPTIPLTRYSGYIHVLPPGLPPDSVAKACTCMSQRPGIRNFPRPSTMCEPAGALTEVDGPITAIRSCSITTVILGCAALPVASITVTRWMTSESAHAIGHSKVNRKTQRTRME